MNTKMKGERSFERDNGSSNDENVGWLTTVGKKKVQKHKSPKKIKCKTLFKRKPLVLLNDKQKTIHSFFDVGKESKDKTDCHQMYSANGSFFKDQENSEAYLKSLREILTQPEVGCQRTEAISPTKTVHVSAKPKLHRVYKDSDRSRYFSMARNHLEHAIKCRKVDAGDYNFQHHSEMSTLDNDDDDLDLNSQNEGLVPFVPILVSSLNTQLSLESSQIGEFVSKPVSSTDMQCNILDSSQVEGSVHKTISTFNIDSSFVPTSYQRIYSKNSIN
ncbi:uncharacterized protein LOC111085392 [Limulus polyphemus]|uniref:Uncharacterized protein LOC111085392 n=1 Tax=Limulus polyphemus TaxID=6850 RepID=A0ABM1S716_LIMPO|nr:uncharacterized protein LOC111085392 [Limulus polyphemus]